MTTATELPAQLDKLYALESVLTERVKATEPDNAKFSAIAAQLMLCLVEQNTLLGLRK